MPVNTAFGQVARIELPAGIDFDAVEAIADQEAAGRR